MSVSYTHLDVYKRQMLDTLERQYHTYQESTRKRRYSVDFDSTNDIHEEDPFDEPRRRTSSSLSKEEDGDGINELRKRLLGKQLTEPGTDTTNKSVDRQIEDQDNMQQNLIQDMTKLVGSLKQGAVAFQTALEEDQRVLGAAEIGIQVASKGIVDISGKLRSYDKAKLGYLFYISVFFFMIIGLIVTFIIIKLFPAL